MGQATDSIYKDKLDKALTHMTSALQLLDDAGAPANIGAHLDMAVCRLKDVMPQYLADVGQTSRTRVPGKRHA